MPVMNKVDNSIKYYLVQYRFIVGESTTDSQFILAFKNEPTRDQLNRAVENIFENMYDGECDRDGVVCLYKGGEICMQYNPFFTPMPTGIALWLKERHVMSVMRCDY